MAGASLIIGGLAAGVGAIAQADAARSSRRAQMSAAERAREDVIESRGGYDQYMEEAEQDIDLAYDRAMGLVDTGMQEMRAEYEGAIDRYDPYAQQGKRALDMYMGMFDDEGGGAANIINTPMFRAQQSEMNKQIAAQMAATGRGGSLKSIESTFAPAQQKLMRQEYANYFNRLNPIIGYGYGASAAQAGLQSNLGNRLMAGRSYQSGIQQQAGNIRSELDRQRAAMEITQGANLANIEMGKGAIQGNYYNQMGNIYGNIANQAAQFAGGLAGQGGNVLAGQPYNVGGVRYA